MPNFAKLVQSSNSEELESHAQFIEADLQKSTESGQRTDAIAEDVRFSVSDLDECDIQAIADTLAELGELPSTVAQSSTHFQTTAHELDPVCALDASQIATIDCATADRPSEDGNEAAAEPRRSAWRSRRKAAATGS